MKICNILEVYRCFENLNIPAEIFFYTKITSFHLAAVFFYWFIDFEIDSPVFIVECHILWEKYYSFDDIDI